jgi:hypothetical protein
VPAGKHFRLVLYVYGLRPLELSRCYDDLAKACAVGEHLFTALEDKPHKQPHRVDVIDLWTRETIARLMPEVPRDRSVCAACGAPSDPFAKEAP